MPEEGSYYLRVFHGDGGNGYDLSWVGNFSDDDYEDNDSRPAATLLAENDWLSQVSGFGFQGDEDWYRMNVREGFDLLDIQAEFSHSEGNINLALYNAQGVKLAGSYSVTDDETIHFKVSGGGQYYIRVYFGNGENPYDLFWKGSAAQYLPLHIH